MASRPARPPRTPIGFQLGAVVVLLGLVAAVIWLNTLVREPAEENAAQQDAEEVDPFEGLPKELPPALQGKEMAKEDPFDSLEKLTDAEVWRDALKLAERAHALIEEAQAAREEGDGGLAREKGKEARELLTKAIESTRAWEEELARERGYSDVQVAHVVDVRSKWVREVMALKKGAGS